MYAIFLRGLRVEARLGIHDFEIASPQRLMVDVALALNDPLGPDNIGAVTDYDFLRPAIELIVGEGHIALQETLCRRILEVCRARANVVAAIVSTAKSDVYPDADAVGCRMFWIADGADRRDVVLALGGF